MLSNKMDGKELKWIIGSVIYLAFGFFVLPRIFILAGFKTLPVIYFLIIPLWTAIGLIIVLLSIKSKNYILRGALIGALTPILFLFISAIADLKLNFLFFNGISGMLIGWLIYASIGAVAGWTINKRKENKEYFFLGD